MATRPAKQFLSEMFNPAAAFPARHISMEGIYEYGSRAGVWRILREFEKRNLPLTVFGVATALQRHPELTAAFAEAGHEIACHGWKWIHYQNLSEEVEREHMALAMDAMAKLTGDHNRQLARRRLVHRARQPQHPPPGGPTLAALNTTATTTATTCPSG
jgi:peptidoglycan/xylan/chitin deacetylase (PgdA/CDA1 family)